MKAIKFPGCNTQIGKGQEDLYNVLPAMAVNDQMGTVVCCFELTPEEIKKVQETGRIYYFRATFGQPFQPMLIRTELEDGHSHQITCHKCFGQGYIAGLTKDSPEKVTCLHCGGSGYIQTKVDVNNQDSKPAKEGN